MPSLVNGLWDFVAALGISVAVVATALWVLVRRALEKWVDHRFSARLQELKNAHDVELRSLEYRMKDRLDRAAKLNEREFSVLPEMWAFLRDAHWHAQSLVASGHYALDFSRMTPLHCEEFIDACDLQPWQKAEFRAATDKSAYYERARRGRDLVVARAKAREASVYLAKNGIFLPEPLYEEFSSLMDQIWKAIEEHEQNELYDLPRQHEHINDFQQNVDERVLALGRLVRSRVIENAEKAAQ